MSDDEYVRRADLHRPDDRDALAAEAQRLRDQGLTCEDVAHCLRLSAEAGRALLEEAA